MVIYKRKEKILAIKNHRLYDDSQINKLIDFLNNKGKTQEEVVKYAHILCIYFATSVLGFSLFY